MIDQRILEILGSIKTSTILTPTRIAFCSPVNQTTSTSKAVIYDTNEKQILATYESKKNKQIMLFRTSEPNIIICANSNFWSKVAEYDYCTTELDLIRQDLYQIAHNIGRMTQDLHHIHPIFRMFNVLTHGTKSIDTRNLYNNFENVLINPLTLQIIMPPLEWIGDNVFTIDEKIIFVEQDRMRIKAHGLNLGDPEAGYYIMQTNRFDYFYVASNYSINPSFNLAYCPSIKTQHKYKKFNGNIISACRMDDQLILGCPKQKYSSSQATTFKLCAWDIQRENCLHSVILEDTIQKLTYIPEKEIAVGIVEKDHADYFYIFNKKMKYKIIKTESAIADIAIFEKEESLILFTNGKIQALDSYINPVYHKKHDAILNSELKSIPKEVVNIIIEYSNANNPFSMFNHKITFSEKAKNFLKLNWKK